jgi:membrane-associated phospholipid phosphatase
MLAIRTKSERIAWLVTEVLSPPLVGAAALGVFTFVVTTSLEQFLMWWLVAVGASCAAPLAFILWGVRKGRFTDHHVTQREQRTIPYLVGLSTASAALAVMVLKNAPKEILAITIAALAGGLILLILTKFTKPSMHVATVTSSAVLLVIHFGPITWPLLILVPIVGWGRMKLKAHTLYHVALGAATGAVVSAVLFGLIMSLI